MQKAKELTVKIGKNVWSSVRENFLFATLNFLFIAVFIQLFNLLFGQENSVVAVIITILMGITAGRDVLAAPVKNFLSTFFVFGGMCAAACFSVYLGAWLAIPINLAVTFLLLYAYTYEYSHHLYFPYILSYLFLIYISPVAPDALPKRLLSVAAGSLVMVLYALALTYRNIRKPAKDALDELLDETRLTVNAYALGGALPDNREKLRGLVRKLCKNTENRRRGTFRISESVFSTLDAARGVETLALYLREPFWNETAYGAEFWGAVTEFLTDCRAYVDRKAEMIPEPDDLRFNRDERTRYLYCVMSFIRAKFLASRKKTRRLFQKPDDAPATRSESSEPVAAPNGTDVSDAAASDAASATARPCVPCVSEPTAGNSLTGSAEDFPARGDACAYQESRTDIPGSETSENSKSENADAASAPKREPSPKKTLSFLGKLKLAVDYSPVRLVYAARVAVLLTVFMIPVQYFALPHGKWLMFTLASVSLPYAEDVPKKGLKRFGATLIGGALALLLFSLVSDPNARTAIMMLSGYLSFYFKDYLGNYAMATVGALGGAVFLTSFGFEEVGSMLLIRVAYIAVGIVIAFFANLVLFPYRKKRATEEIYKKYELTSDFLSDLKTVSIDRQLYYKIVVENNLLEEKLLSNAKRAEPELAPVIESRRRKIRRAHHENFRESA